MSGIVRLRERLDAGERGLSGLFVTGTGAEIVEMAGLSGLQYVVLDGEHGEIWSEAPNLIRTAQAVGLSSLVRVPCGQVHQISQALDYGADGVLVPGVRAVEEVFQAIKFAKFPPLGHRGAAFSTRAADYGYRSGPEYLDQQNRLTMLWIQVETLEVLSILDDLVAMAGVDGFFIGPTDLSVALGEGGIRTPRVDEAIQATIGTLSQTKKFWGIFTGDASARARRVAEGADLVATATPLMMREALARWQAQ